MASAVFFPAAIAFTTKLAPVVASPQAKTLSTLLFCKESTAIFSEHPQQAPTRKQFPPMQGVQSPLPKIPNRHQ